MTDSEYVCIKLETADTVPLSWLERIIEFDLTTILSENNSVLTAL